MQRHVASCSVMQDHAAAGSGSGVTWRVQAVLVPGNGVIQRLQHHPDGEDEHSRQDAIKDEVEEENET